MIVVVVILLVVAVALTAILDHELDQEENRKRYEEWINR